MKSSEENSSIRVPEENSSEEFQKSSKTGQELFKTIRALFKTVQLFEEALFEWPETETGNLKKPEEETADKKKRYRLLIHFSCIFTSKSFAYSPVKIFSHIYL